MGRMHAQHLHAPARTLPATTPAFTHAHAREYTLTHVHASHDLRCTQAQAMRGPQGAAASTQTTQQTGSLGGLKGKSPQTTSPPPQQQQQAGAGGEQKKTQANKKKKGKK